MRITTIIAIVLASAIAHADATEDARKYFEAGKQAYEAGQYVASIAALLIVIQVAASSLPTLARR